MRAKMPPNKLFKNGDTVFKNDDFSEEQYYIKLKCL